jgi:hypothetical protein
MQKDEINNSKSRRQLPLPRHFPIYPLEGQQFQDQVKEGALPDTSLYSSYGLNRAFHRLQKISILTSVSQTPLDIPIQ